MNERILVTGAQGFIGRYLVAEALRAGAGEVLGVGRSAPAPQQFTHSVTRNGVKEPALLTAELAEAMARGNFQYRMANIADEAAVAAIISDFEPDCVVHLAATRREETVDELIRGNVQGVATLLQACGTKVRAKRNCVERFLLASTGGVYGEPSADSLPIRESCSCVPLDTYAASKLAGEHLARVLCARFGVHLVVARIFNVVGPGQEERHVCGRFGSQVAGIAHAHQPPVISVTSLSATRDYIDVRDVAAALMLLAVRGVPGETYNIASGVESTAGEILAMLCDHAGIRNDVQIKHLEPTAGIPRHFASVKKLAELGFHPRFDLAESLRGVLDYYLPIEHFACTSPASHCLKVS
jgi:nucleoside-diphosphate-sugar epimerase